ncbi:MAG: DUF1501 domain-containing protein [Verrucomicrobiales bacterium]|nr:DUF1501 domain-containing protein [Verrucomicrobiales bacterium]
MNPALAALHRRRFLQTAGAGLGGLALDWLLHSEATAAAADPVHPMAARLPTFAPRAKSVIFLYMVGGPSSIDLFDYKPQLQKLGGKPVPESLRKAVEATRFANIFTACRDELLASPWAWKQHGQSGMWVSELYPEVARHVDDLCFIHSMQADSNNHAPASIQLHTGDTNGGKASIGSWITYGLGTDNQNLPAYVLLFDYGPLGGATNYSNGFLPAAFQGTRLRDSTPPVLDLLPPQRFAAGQADSLTALRELNLLHRAARPGFPELDARIASYELAYRMQSAALEVADLDKEPKCIRDRYGVDHADAPRAKFARKCLLARRLVERGVRFVQLYDMFDKDGWDAHENLKKNHEQHAAVSDQAIGALLSDLKQTGLLESTLVVWASEFGRTPMVQGTHGRQHNYAGFTIWMAGGGVRPGLRLGATDELGLMAVDRPIAFRDLHATILSLLGMAHDSLSYEVSGRMERLTGVQNTAHIIPEVLGV